MRIRTGYSFRTAVGHLDEILDRIIETGSDVATITDRFSTFGYRRFRDECKKKNLRPVYGVELGVVEKLNERKPIINYWTFIAKSDIRSVNDLVSQATTDSNKEPALLLKYAVNCHGVFKIIGERATYEQLMQIRGAEDCFLALGPSTPKKTVSAALLNNIPLIAVSDNYYPRKEDREFYRVALGRRASTQTYPQHILTDEEWFEAVKYIVKPEEAEKAIQNRKDILQQSNADLLKAQMYKPPRPKTLREMCIEGAARTGTDLNDPIYAARLDRELSVIEEKDFEDYFYITINIFKRIDYKFFIHTFISSK